MATTTVSFTAPYPHFGDVGLCDLIACNRDNYDGHEYWANAESYARDHHADGTVCTHIGPCESLACHKRATVVNEVAPAYVLAAHTRYGVEISDGRTILATVSNVLDAQMWAYQNSVAIRFA